LPSFYKYSHLFDIANVIIFYKISNYLWLINWLIIVVNWLIIVVNWLIVCRGLGNNLLKCSECFFVFTMIFVNF